MKPGAKLPGTTAPRVPAPRRSVPRGGPARGKPPAWAGAPAVPDELVEVTTRARGRFALGVLGFAMVALVARAAWIMTMPNPYIEAHGKELYQAAKEITGGRGAIVDREGRILAWSVLLPSLYVNASRFPQAEVDARAPAIAAATGEPIEAVTRRLRNTGNKRFRLGVALEPEQARALTAGLKGDQLWLENEPARMYPGKELASPLLGNVDVLGTGADGLERLLDDRLAGETHTVVKARDRKDRNIEAALDPTRLERPGRTARLTIDAAIQGAAEAALQEVMVASVPEAAMAVVLDVHDGQLLALASVPAGNPNDPTLRGKHELFKNHAAMDQVEPGSVMKPFVVAGALEEGLTTPDELVDCMMGSMAIADRVIRDDHPKGVISVTEIIKFSSNIGTAKLGFRLGADKMLRYLSDFGFARATGLGLPGEVAGQMRKADSIRPIELATTAFGQGVTASPIQLAAAMATLANGGVRVTPSIVDAWLDHNGELLEAVEPKVDRRVVSEDTAHAMARMMETVIEEGGTGTRARVPGYRVGGKTGTAQKVEGGVYSATKRVSSFVGFLPADRPEVAIVVVVDSPTVGSKYGGIAAAPAFAQIGAFTMRYLGIQPDPSPAPVAAAPPPPVATPIEVAADGEGAWILPDLRGRSMRGTLDALAPTGLALSVRGYGRLADQHPAPGSKVRPGDPVILRFH